MALAILDFQKVLSYFSNLEKTFEKVGRGNLSTDQVEVTFLDLFPGQLAVFC